MQWNWIGFVTCLDYRNRQFKRFITGKEREVSREVILVVQRSSVNELAKKYGDWTVEQLARQFPSASLNILVVSHRSSMRSLTIKQLAQQFSGQTIEQIAMKVSAEIRFNEALMALSQGTLTIAQAASRYSYLTINQLIIISRSNTSTTSSFIANYLRQLQLIYGNVTFGWLAPILRKYDTEPITHPERAMSTFRRLYIDIARIRGGAEIHHLLPPPHISVEPWV